MQSPFLLCQLFSFSLENISTVFVLKLFICLILIWENNLILLGLFPDINWALILAKDAPTVENTMAVYVYALMTTYDAMNGLEKEKARQGQTARLGIVNQK